MSFLSDLRGRRTCECNDSRNSMPRAHYADAYDEELLSRWNRMSYTLCWYVWQWGIIRQGQKVSTFVKPQTLEHFLWPPRANFQMWQASVKCMWSRIHPIPSSKGWRRICFHISKGCSEETELVNFHICTVAGGCYIGISNQPSSIIPSIPWFFNKVSSEYHTHSSLSSEINSRRCRQTTSSCLGGLPLTGF